MSKRHRRYQSNTSRELAVIDRRHGGEVVAFGGGLEGAERTSAETMRWNPSRLSPDQILNGLNGMSAFGAKSEADFRGRDVVTNDGYGQGVVDINRDSIVGAQYRLNAQPNFTVLTNEVSKSFDQEWADEYQVAVEEKFNLLSDSDFCWFDVSRKFTFTGLVRLAIAGFVYTGEVLGTGEYIDEPGRPFKTAFQMVSPTRLSNPFGQVDSATLRNGIVKDSNGKPTGFWFRDAYPTEFYMGTKTFNWTLVPAFKPWGRRIVVHIADAIQPAQSRGIAGLVAILKQMRMTKKFQEVVLQNAVVNASYAATIESELPSDVIAAMMGGGQPGVDNPAAAVAQYAHAFMNTLNAYLEKANGVAVDGVKMPHLFPGTKLNARALGTPGGVGTEFETSLLRHIAAGLGLSYEEFANDFSKTNYSSGKASMIKTWKHLSARKRFVADRFASELYSMWLEEQLNSGYIPMPRNYDYRVFYGSDGMINPVVKEALCSCDWIGAGKGQIDELKETQAALLRINGGLSTWENEIARFGGDWRKTFRQRAREDKMAKDLKLDFSLAAEKSGAASGQQVMQDTKETTP